MSYSNLKRAMELAKQCKYYKIGGKQDSLLVPQIEETYGFKLSPQHCEYFSHYGYLMFFGTKFYGIYEGVFDGVYAGNAVIATLENRKEYNLPKEWIPIYDYSDGYIAYLDYAHLNTEKEPRIILAIYTGQKYKVTDVIAEDLGDFILEFVQQQLESQ